MTNIPQWAKDAARELRIRMHDMGEAHIYPSCRASHPENARWLDRVCIEDARVIAKHAPRIESPIPGSTQDMIDLEIEGRRSEVRELVLAARKVIENGVGLVHLSEALEAFKEIQ